MRLIARFFVLALLCASPVFAQTLGSGTLGGGGGGGTVTSVTGTTNRVTSTGGATPVIDLATIIGHSVTAGITACTTQTQGQCPLTSEINEVSVVANDNDVVTLPSASANVGATITIINNSATKQLRIYPASGHNLNGTVNAPTNIYPKTRVAFVAYNTTSWRYSGVTYTGQASTDDPTSIIPLSNGGLGTTTFGTAHGLIASNGILGFNTTSAGTANQVLTSNGSGLDPTFQTFGTGSTAIVKLFPGGAATDGTGSGNNTAALTSMVSSGTQTTNTPKVTHLMLLFDGTTDEHWEFSLLLPNDYISGGTLRGKLTFTSATTGNAIMKAGISCLVDNSTNMTTALFAAGDLSSAIAAPGTAGLTVPFTISLTMTNAAANRPCAVFIGRDSDNASDTITTDAEMASLNFEYVR